MGTARRQQSKRSKRGNRRRTVPRRFFKDKPRGKKDAEVIGIVSKINKEHEIEQQEKRDRIQSKIDSKQTKIDSKQRKIYRIKQGMEANDRRAYHELRLTEANRQHESKCAKP